VGLCKEAAEALKSHPRLGSFVFSARNGAMLSRHVTPRPAPIRGEASRSALYRIPLPQAHLLLAPRHARSGAEGDSGARRTLDAQHDPAVHAPGAERALRSDRFAQISNHAPSVSLGLPQPVGPRGLRPLRAADLPQSRARSFAAARGRGRCRPCAVAPAHVVSGRAAARGSRKGVTS
jgi:hypothetical protein